MFQRELTRRQLLKSAAAGTAASLLGLPRQLALAADVTGSIKITEPFHGAVFNHRHGKQTAEAITIRVAGKAKPTDKVTVNGQPARREGNRFEAGIPLREHESDIVAVAERDGGREENRIRVVWDRYSEPRYRFGIDDNSFFLRDIAQKKYKSLFECFYLKGLRDLHEKYRTKFVLNCYYAAADDLKLPTDSDFRLPQLSDRYKGEFRDNADWLKLTFHAYANMPEYPYTDAPPERLLADLDLVAAEIRRFAGEETYVLPSVIHWAMTRQSALKPLFERGVRVLSGRFSRSGDKWDINYNWDNVVSEYCSKHDAWKDFNSGIVFSCGSICCDRTPVDQTATVLENATKDSNTAEIVDIVTHEQYFWPFYFNYVPDHFQRLDTTLRWVTDHGYKPVLFTDGFLGGRV